MTPEIIEGRWEEIEQQAGSLTGKRVRITILPDTSNVPVAPDNVDPQRSARARIRALDDLARQNAGLPSLAPEAFDRESLYADDSEAA